MLTRAAGRLLLFVGLAFSLHARQSFAQNCPQACTNVGRGVDSGSPPTCGPSPTGTVTYSDGASPSNSARCIYDLHLGTAEAHTTNTAHALTDAADRYVVNGAPAGTPVSLTVRLNVTGFTQTSCFVSCSFARLSVSVADSGGASISYATPSFPGTSVAQTLDLPLTKLAGQPFRINWSIYAISASADFRPGTADGKATLSFMVPAGMTIGSCSGYVGSVVTASTPASWGTLKIRYR
jgi:hypothetical protein